MLRRGSPPSRPSFYASHQQLMVAPKSSGTMAEVSSAATHGNTLKGVPLTTKLGSQRQLAGRLPDQPARIACDGAASLQRGTVSVTHILGVNVAVQAQPWRCLHHAGRSACWSAATFGDPMRRGRPRAIHASPPDVMAQRPAVLAASRSCCFFSWRRRLQAPHQLVRHRYRQRERRHCKKHGARHSVRVFVPGGWRNCGYIRCSRVPWSYCPGI